MNISLEIFLHHFLLERPALFSKLSIFFYFFPTTISAKNIKMPCIKIIIIIIIILIMIIIVIMMLMMMMMMIFDTLQITVVALAGC